MDWISRHLPLVGTGAVLVVIVIGSALVWDKTATGPATEGANSFSQYGGRITDTTRTVVSDTREVPQQRDLSEGELFRLFAEDEEQAQYTSLIPRTNAFKSTDIATNTAFSYTSEELEELLANISPSAQAVAPQEQFGAEASLESIYRYVPASLATTTTVRERPDERTEALLMYGNEIGASIQSYETRWSDQALILRRFVEDMDNPEKAQRVADLADALVTLGDSIENTSPDLMPSDIAPMNAALANGYREIGEKLRVVGQARSNPELLDAVTAYNTAARSFANKYLAIVTLMSVEEVPFNKDDPGSVFVFEPTVSLQ